MSLKMPPMLIPTHCDACMRAALVAALLVEAGYGRCEGCGAAARVLPGETYGPQDEPLFVALEESVAGAGLTPLHAVHLAVALDGRNTLPGVGLKRLAQMLPSPTILDLLAANDSSAMRKAEGMLVALLEAVAAGRSKSEAVPKVAAAPPSKQGGGSG
jgi:hypothetical protein